ncbi:MAG: tetratricopeptide repeat protein [Anaerolineales bacterium]|jgi:tetratricopeptide (TPR) repeat protein
MNNEQDQRFQRSMDLGHSAAWDQDWHTAAEYYRQALNQKPEDTKAINSLALAMFEMREYDDALRLYLQAAQLAPNDPIPLEKSATLYEKAEKPEAAAEMAVRAAELYLNHKDVDRAIENWSRAVSLFPEHLRAHSRLAIVFERLGRKPQAAREYIIIASLLQHAGDISKAIDAVNRALKVDPNNSEAMQALALLREGILLPKPARPRGGTGPIQAKKNQHQITAPKVKDTLQLNPIDEAKATALEILAELFFDQPSDEVIEDDSSRRGFQSIVSGTGPLFLKKIDRNKIMLHLSQAVDYQLSENFAQAAEELDRAINAGLDNMAAYFQLGALRYDANRLESAIRYLQRAVKHPDFSLASRLIIGDSYLRIGRTQEAAVEFMEALKLADSMIVPLEQADSLRQLYDPLIEAQAQDTNETNQKELCKSISEILVRNNWRDHLQRFRSQSMAEDSGQLMPLVEILSETHGSEVVVAMSNVRQLARNGQLHAAVEEAFFALEYAPTYLPLHFSIGELLLTQDLVPEAIEKFLVVARSYSVRGEAGRAIETLRRVVSLSPMDLKARNELINQLIARGASSEAVEEYFKLAEVYYSLADLTNSRKAYVKALRLAQISNLDINWQVRVLHRIADIDIQSLNWRQAALIFKEVVKLKPDDEKGYAGLLNLNFRLGEGRQAIKELDNYIQYLNTNNRSSDAIRFLEKQVEERPQQAAIRRRLGELYFMAGNLEKAVQQLDLTQEILTKSGDRVGVIAVVQRIIEMNPPDVEKYRNMLQSLQLS